MDGETLTVGWVALIGVGATIFAFTLGFCTKTRLVERQLDELIVVVKRPPTFTTLPPPTSSSATYRPT